MSSYVIVDVFTDTALEGNPLAVFTAADPGIPAERMQQIAREMNLSETVFVLPPETGGDARIRIFTPSMELPFAGHPTLGTAVVLGEAGDADGVRLETGAGVIAVEFERADGRISRGRMRQPVPTWEPYGDSAGLFAALGVEGSQLPLEVYCNGPRHVFVALPSRDAVAALDPDMGALGKLVGLGVNCFAGAGVRWKTRMFGPGLGVAEDPATGSGAGPLAVHLCRHGVVGFGEEIQISQGVEIGRPSTLYARADGAGDRIDLVEVSGSAVIVARGELHA